MAFALQASLLVRRSPPEVAGTFVASRLEGDAGLAFGTLAPGTDFAAIVDRARPRLD
jgi:putative acyl-CoA dehydrogenase